MTATGHVSDEAPCRTMHELLRQRLAANELITTADAGACGIGHHALARLVRSGLLHRLRRGAFVDPETWKSRTPEQRHLLRCRATLPHHADGALSHTSAMVAHGLAVFSVDLDVIHLSRTGGTRRGRQGGVQIHPALPSGAFTTAAGLPACTAAVAALQVADWHGPRAGMVAAESALHHGACTSADLGRARDLVRLGRGRAHADLVVDLAGPLSESPGETLTRLLLHTIGLPAPQQQARVALADGRTARVDFLLPQWDVVIEFDGAVKYEGADGRAELIREKHREDAIRAAGLQVVRLTWPDLDQPARVRTLVLDARSRASHPVGSR